MDDFVCVCVFKIHFFKFQIGKIDYFLPLTVQRETFVGYIFKFSIPLHKCAVILPKTGKIRKCLTGNNRKEREGEKMQS